MWIAEEVFPPVLKGLFDTNEPVLTWLNEADDRRARDAPPFCPPMSSFDDSYAVVCFVSLSGGVLGPVPDDDGLKPREWPGRLRPEGTLRVAEDISEA